MRIFDPHVHMTSRAAGDYERMAAAGVRAVVEPAFWPGRPRTTIGSFVDYFDGLVEWEPTRAGRYGIRHHCAIALNPKEAGDRRSRDILALVARYLAKPRVVAVGEIGYDSITPQEDIAFAGQLALARDLGLPALVHTPRRESVLAVRRSLEVVRESGIDPARVVIDHLDESSAAEVAGTGCWMGFPPFPPISMSPGSMVNILRRYGLDRVLVNSAAGWGRSDPLSIRRTGDAMVAAGFSLADVDKVLWRNPFAFYAQSGRLDVGAGRPLSNARFCEGVTVAGRRYGDSPARPAGGHGRYRRRQRRQAGAGEAG